MSLMQCVKCGCVENTNGTSSALWVMPSIFDWNGLEEFKGKRLCCVCMPLHYSSGEIIEKAGKWHNRFKRVFLPKGDWHTNSDGNLENDKGEIDYSEYEIGQK